MLAAETRDYPISPVPLTEVTVTGGFWLPRLETNRKVTVPYDFRKCDETGRLSNFAKAGGLMDGAFEGTFFNDSDVFKVIEGAAYTLARQRNPKLEAFLDDLIARIAAAQEDDGYLYTIRSIQPDKVQGACGATRWSNLGSSHELYNVGHMYEAAVAYAQATGKRTLLEVAEKNAALIGRVFGPAEGQRRDPPGHQEIEIGLVKLYRFTGNPDYLALAKFFLDVRGNPAGRRKLYGQYNQDHMPVTQQAEAVGHAVRACYMYAGMTDVAALSGDAAYVRAVDLLWDSVVGRKLALTGGVGARHRGEAFGADYELPNESAYNETCAAIANALWQHRLFLLHGNARYVDVLERIIYNGFLAGISLSGDRFFYPNPLASDGVARFNHGSAGRAPWFGCSCCPVNVVRFIPSIPGYAYAVEDETLFVCLFAAGRMQVQIGGQTVAVTQQTDYPWDGAVVLTIEPAKAANLTVKIRIPGWARNQPVPSDLYRYADGDGEVYRIAVNGKAVSPLLERGFAVLHRRWQPGDRIELQLPMPVRRVVADPKVDADRGRVALERGPLVYCFEAVDNGGEVRDLIIDSTARFKAERRPELLGGVTVLTGQIGRAQRQPDGTVAVQQTQATAVPYYAWAHRELGPMTVWPAAKLEQARPRPAPTLASEATPAASHCHAQDALAALNDQIEPKNSIDHDIPRFTWWDHRGGMEWVQYSFRKPTQLKAVSVYWFDTTIRSPASIFFRTIRLPTSDGLRRARRRWCIPGSWP